jgi:hypothetical protein
MSTQTTPPLRELSPDDVEVVWLAAAVKHALSTDSLAAEIAHAEANRPASERLCNEDGALYLMSQFFNSLAGSALFVSMAPHEKVVFTFVDHDDDKSAVMLPLPPYAFVIKTNDSHGLYVPIIF